VFCCFFFFDNGGLLSLLSFNPPQLLLVFNSFLIDFLLNARKFAADGASVEQYSFLFAYLFVFICLRWKFLLVLEMSWNSSRYRLLFTKKTRACVIFLDSIVIFFCGHQLRKLCVCVSFEIQRMRFDQLLLLLCNFHKTINCVSFYRPSGHFLKSNFSRSLLFFNWGEMWTRAHHQLSSWSSSIIMIINLKP
jgi:hypothetical protein